MNEVEKFRELIIKRITPSIIVTDDFDQGGQSLIIDLGKGFFLIYFWNGASVELWKGEKIEDMFFPCLNENNIFLGANYIKKEQIDNALKEVEDAWWKEVYGV